jgi:16S rRNA U1498 N3-methylase RsmE
MGLGRRILRVETAAVVGATILLDRSGRLSQ